MYRETNLKVLPSSTSQSKNGKKRGKLFLKSFLEKIFTIVFF